MKVTIILTDAEKAGIVNYLKEVDEITDQSTQNDIDLSISHEVKTRITHALRDPREAISNHIITAENE
jgi:hypothetical protein